VLSGAAYSRTRQREWDLSGSKGEVRKPVENRMVSCLERRWQLGNKANVADII
jgi:hypothetical protein